MKGELPELDVYSMSAILLGFGFGLYVCLSGINATYRPFVLYH